MNPWSCSKFADFLRGEPKPGALGFDEWEEWRDRVRSERPWGYFLAERALPALQKTIQSPARIVRSARYYLRNRFVTKTHFLKTGLEPGVYHELDERIIHGLFNELRNFVEVELACMTAYGDKNYRFRKGRCPEAGLAHLEWASGLKYDELVGKDDPRCGEPTPQAESAVAIKELYEWWTEVRPRRPEPTEASGWSEHWEKKSDDKERRAASKRLQKIEREYEREDDRMMVKLVKLRRHLWT
jgi:hypothetical protein